MTSGSIRIGIAGPRRLGDAQYFQDISALTAVSLEWAGANSSEAVIRLWPNHRWPINELRGRCRPGVPTTCKERQCKVDVRPGIKKILYRHAGRRAPNGFEQLQRDQLAVHPEAGKLFDVLRIGHIVVDAMAVERRHRKAEQCEGIRRNDALPGRSRPWRDIAAEWDFSSASPAGSMCMMSCSSTMARPLLPKNRWRSVARSLQTGPSRWTVRSRNGRSRRSRGAQGIPCEHRRTGGGASEPVGLTRSFSADRRRSADRGTTLMQKIVCHPGGSISPSCGAGPGHSSAAASRSTSSGATRSSTT